MTPSKVGARLLIMPDERKYLPLIPLRNVVLFPSVETSLFFGRKESSNSLLEAYDKHNHLCIITAQRDSTIDKPALKDIYTVAILARIEHILQTDAVSMLLSGVSPGLIY